MLDEFTMHLTPFGKDRRVRLWLPDGMGKSDARYPVMYFFDGHNLFRDEWATYGKCWGLASFLEGWGKDIIIVAPECDQEGDNRLIEYAPYEMDIPPYGHFPGRGGETMDWLVGELKPRIDERYPTYSFREATGIGGSSMGGLMSMFAVLRYNGQFSKAACLSSSFQFCARQMLGEAKRDAISADTRVYLSWGSAECRSKSDLTGITDLNLKLSRILSRKGAHTFPYLHVGGGHCEADWEKEVPQFMDYLWRE